jgi:hypothetical protein
MLNNHEKEPIMSKQHFQIGCSNIADRWSEKISVHLVMWTAWQLGMEFRLLAAVPTN